MDTHRASLTQGRPSQPPRSLLARCRCRSVRLVLLAAMWLSLLPASLLHADDDVPPANDTWWGDVWRWVDGGQQWFAYQNVGEWGDSDNDGIPNLLDLYAWDASNNTAWWQQSNVWVDATLNATLEWAYAADRTWQYDWNDYDGDGLPNWCDPHPYDGSNNTTWWNGRFNVDGSARDLGGVFASNAFDANDYDGDGIPNAVDPYLWDASNNTSRWDKETWVDALWRQMDGLYATSGGWQDRDNDGLPDWADPYPDDATNDTSWWHGGQYWIDGQQQWFGDANTPYATAWDDSDHDGIPNFADPMPYDAANNTTWWNGEYQIDGSLHQLGGVYAASGLDWSDYDGDGIPNFVDPYLNDSWNNNSPYYANVPMWQDSDGDGMADDTDPYPYDASNNTTQWYAPEQRYVNGMLHSFGGSYATDTLDWNDYDGDGLPTFADPYPYDATNNTTTWSAPQPGYVNGALQQLGGAYATSSIDMNDNDADGIPNFADRYPDDPDNNTAWWWGQTWVDGAAQDVIAAYAATTDTSTWSDRDEDGLPDWADPYPDDFSNNTSWWEGSSLVDGTLQDVSATFAANTDTTGWSDLDNDGLPDWLDPYPDDPDNNTAWWSKQALVDGAIQEIGGTYAASAGTAGRSDRDNDGLPDWVDPYPDDAENNTVLWNWQTIVDGVQREVMGSYAATTDTSRWSDRDDDGLPDWLDPYPDDFSNNSTAWEGEYFIDGLRVTLSGVSAVAGQDTGDDDNDGLPNFIDPYRHDAMNNTTFWSGTAWVDGQEEEFAVVTSASNVMQDGDSDGLPDVIDPYPADSSNNTAFWNGSAYAPDTDDADADGIPDSADPYPYDETNTPPTEPEDDGVVNGESVNGVPVDNTPVNYAAVAAAALNGAAGVPLVDVPQIDLPPPTVNLPVPQVTVSIPTPTVLVPTIDVPVVTAPTVSVPSLDAATVGRLAALALPVVSAPVVTDAQALAALAGQVPPTVAAAPQLRAAGDRVPPFEQVPQPTADDTDGDGLDDVTEALEALTDPTDVDTDDDGLFDGWEVAHDLNPLDAADIQTDTDHDGLSNAKELLEGSDPGKPDTDGGGMLDGQEVEMRQVHKLIADLQDAGAQDEADILEGLLGNGGGDLLDPKDDNGEPPEPKELPAPPEEPEEEPLPDVIIFPPEGMPYDEADVGKDNDGDGVLVPEDPDDNDPDVPNERDLDADGVGHKTDPNDSDPNNPNRQPPPPGEKLKDKLAREKQEKADAHDKRNKELHNARKERQQARTDARQAAHDMNELLNHPHGNHGNGVKNPGTRGTRTDGNANGALPFQPTASYAKTSAYQNQAWENRMFQHVRDTDSRLDGLSATERQAVLGQLSHDAKHAGINGNTDPAFAAQWISGQVGTIIDGAPQAGGAPRFGNGGNIFANRDALLQGQIPFANHLSPIKGRDFEGEPDAGGITTSSSSGVDQLIPASQSAPHSIQAATSTNNGSTILGRTTPPVPPPAPAPPKPVIPQEVLDELAKLPPDVAERVLHEIASQVRDPAVKADLERMAAEQGSKARGIEEAQKFFPIESRPEDVIGEALVNSFSTWLGVAITADRSGITLRYATNEEMVTNLVTAGAAGVMVKGSKIVNAGKAGAKAEATVISGLKTAEKSAAKTATQQLEKTVVKTTVSEAEKAAAKATAKQAERAAAQQAEKAAADASATSKPLTLGDVKPGTQTNFGPRGPLLNKADKYGNVSTGQGTPARIVEQPSGKVTTSGAVQGTKTAPEAANVSPLDYDHVIGGDFNSSGRATGGHSLVKGDVRIAPGATLMPPDASGVYQAPVEVYNPTTGQWVPKTSNQGVNTMFPQHWSENQIKMEVDAAWNSPAKVVNHDKWQSVTPSGVKVEGYTTPRVTAYPVYNPD